MRIIKEGILPKKVNVIYAGKCYNCKCEVELDEEEALSLTQVMYFNGRLRSMIVKCPTRNCNDGISIYEKGKDIAR